MRFAYAFLVHLFQWVLPVLSRLSPKLRQFYVGRQDWNTHLKQQTQAWRGQQVAWFHAASLGEFEQGRPVIETLRAQHPDFKILLTFFSPSGYEIRKDYDGADVVCYLPLDTAANARQFLEVVQPSVAFFIKYEFWHHFLHELRRRRTPTLLFSAIFRPNQLFFKWYGGFYRAMLFCFDHVLVQNEASARLLQTIGYQSVTVAGDTRLDRVLHVAQQAREIPLVAQFVKNHPTLIVGSAWPDDMEVLIPFLNQFDRPLKVIIAPHEINATQIEQWKTKLNKPTISYSSYHTITAPNHQTTIPPQYHVLFIDNIGLLSSLYRYGDFAYIGGAFGDGLHNILEPAAFGMPIFFGNKFYHKFQEAHDLIAQGCAHAVADADALRKAFEELYVDEAKRKTEAESARAYVQAHAGATAKVLEWVSNFQTSK